MSDCPRTDNCEWPGKGGGTANVTGPLMLQFLGRKYTVACVPERLARDLEQELARANKELGRVMDATVTGPDGHEYHWVPGVGWCEGHPPSAPAREIPVFEGTREALDRLSVRGDAGASAVTTGLGGVSND